MRSSSDESDTTSNSASGTSEDEAGGHETRKEILGERDLTEINKLNQASIQIKSGRSNRQVLAGTAARKGLVDTKTFHERTRVSSSKVRLKK